MTTETAGVDVDAIEARWMRERERDGWDYSLDAELVIREDIPALIAEARRLRAENAELRCMLVSATSTAHVALGHDGAPWECGRLLCDASYRLLPREEHTHRDERGEVLG